MKLVHVEDEIFLYVVCEFQPHILYNLGDMIPPNQGSSILQNIVLNR